jgi:hypothetical protein
VEVGWLSAMVREIRKGWGNWNGKEKKGSKEREPAIQQHEKEGML